jgi:hypothetical protein
MVILTNPVFWLFGTGSVVIGLVFLMDELINGD